MAMAAILDLITLIPPKYDNFKFVCSLENKVDCTSLKYVLQMRKWEKQLQQIFDETNVTKLCKAAENHIQKYFENLPKPGRKERLVINSITIKQ